MCTGLLVDLEKVTCSHVADSTCSNPRKAKMAQKRFFDFTQWLLPNASPSDDGPCFCRSLKAIRAAGAAWHDLLSLGGLHGECNLKPSREGFLPRHDLRLRQDVFLKEGATSKFFSHSTELWGDGMGWPGSR